MKYSFFLVVFTVFFGLLSYVLIRGIQTLPTEWKNPYIWGFCGGTLLLITGLFMPNFLPQDISKMLTFIGYTFLIVVVYFFLSFLLVDLIRLFNHLLHFAAPGMHSFRLWVFGGTAVLVIFALLMGNYRFRHPQIVPLELTTLDKARKDKTLKIVAASDIHLDHSIDINMLRKYVQLINDQKPDIVLLLGDVTDRSATPLTEQNMKSVLETLHAPNGVFAIRGNHEYYSGNAEAIAGYLRSSGIHVLVDSAYLINNSFYLIGRDDRTNPNRKSLEDITKNLDPKLPRILLDHQPYRLEEAEQNDIDLQLSGHTHNGQFFPGNLLTKWIFEQNYGYLKKGKTQYYVSSGLGIWGPQYRIGTKSELVVIQWRY